MNCHESPPNKERPSAKPSKDTRHLRGLDGLRALAVTLVFFDHATRPGHLLQTGASGVWLFFVLSGFLIIGILNDQAVAIKHHQQTYWRAVYEFYVRRFFRIFPPYYLVLLAIVIAIAFFGLAGVSWYDLAVVALYCTNLFPQPNTQSFTWFLTHFWSLAVEEQFYLFAAPVFLLVHGRAAFWICAFMIFVSLATTAALINNHSPVLDIYENSIINFGMFAVGGLASLKPVRRGLPGKSFWRPLACLFLFVLAPIVFAYFKPLEVFRPQIFCIISCMLVVSVSANQNSFVTETLEWKPIRGLGRISYTFYLVHPFFIIHGDAAGVSRLFGLAIPFHIIPPFAQILEFSAAVFVAWLSWTNVEGPLLRFRNKK